jgi:flagellar protein FliS
MTAHRARAAAATYQQVEVTSRSPLELVVMLYDGALAAMQNAALAMRRRDLLTKREAMNKALQIVQHLQSTLNMEEGADVAGQLDQLYGHVISRILEANVTGTPELIEEAARLLQTVRVAWAEVAALPAPDAPATPTAPLAR